jgi:hypothetical protein
VNRHVIARTFGVGATPPILLKVNAREMNNV